MRPNLISILFSFCNAKLVTPTQSPPSQSLRLRSGHASAVKGEEVKKWGLMMNEQRSARLLFASEPETRNLKPETAQARYAAADSAISAMAVASAQR
jgi:hypothetical protein